MYARPTPTTGLRGVIDTTRPETDPAQRAIIAHQLEGEAEVSSIFRDNPSTKVIVSPTEMVFRSDWQSHKVTT